MGVKKLNQLKKFMQIEVDLKRMEIKFGGRDFSSFGDIVLFLFAFKMAKISLYSLPLLLPLPHSFPIFLLDYINMSIKVNTYSTAPVPTTIN